MRKTYQAVRRYRRNTIGRDFVVGDLHGCFSQLDAQLARVGYDNARDRLFSVGDLVNRGPESAAVLDAVRRHRIKAVLGNREDMIVQWYFCGGDGWQLETNGGAWFIELASQSWALIRSKARSIVRYMAALPYGVEIETAYGLVGLLHADAPRENWGELAAVLEHEDRHGPTRKRVLWQRTRWIGLGEYAAAPVSSALASLFGLSATGPAALPIDPHRRIEGVVAVIVGHTPVPEPTVRGNVINIDTGGAYGRELTILNLAELPQWLARGAS